MSYVKNDGGTVELEHWCFLMMWKHHSPDLSWIKHFFFYKDKIEARKDHSGEKQATAEGAAKIT